MRISAQERGNSENREGRAEAARSVGKFFLKKMLKRGLRFEETGVKLKRWLGETLKLLAPLAPDWRNRQTRWIQNPLPARASRFDSGIRYKPRRDLVSSRFFLFLRLGLAFGRRSACDGEKKEGEGGEKKLRDVERGEGGLRSLLKRGGKRKIRAGRADFCQEAFKEGGKRRKRIKK